MPWIAWHLTPTTYGDWASCSTRPLIWRSAPGADHTPIAGLFALKQKAPVGQDGCLQERKPEAGYVMQPVSTASDGWTSSEAPQDRTFAAMPVGMGSSLACPDWSSFFLK